MPVEEGHLMPDHVHMLQATGFAGSLILAAVFGSGLMPPENGIIAALQLKSLQY